LASGQDLKSGRVYFQAVLDFRPVSSAYWPPAGISNPKWSIFRPFWIFDPVLWLVSLGWDLNPKGSIFRPFCVFNPFPQPTGLGLGSEILKGLFSDPSRLSTYSLGQ